MKRNLIMLAALFIILASVGLFLSRRQHDLEMPQPRPRPVPSEVKVQDTQPLQPAIVVEARAPDLAPSSREEKQVEVASAPAVQPGVSSSQQAQKKQAGAANNSPKPPKAPKEPLKDPLARVALSMVGFDADAEDYWLMAINDPNITGEEKEDLIEDLNEEGFDDPRNITPDDIPLILSRIDIIETHAPFAMDELNARAFAEAYKDLWNMFAKASGY